MIDFRKYVSTMETFKKQLDNPLKKESASNITRIKKNIVLLYPSDAAGCGHIRTIFPSTYLNSIFGKSKKMIPVLLPFFVFKPEVLIYTRSLFFQRAMNPKQRSSIEKYKEMQERYKYKMIYDIDDFIYSGDDYGEGVPDYNFGKMTLTKEVSDLTIDLMNMMDIVTVSTKFLGDYLKNKCGVKTEIKVLPNTVPHYFYGPNKRSSITEKIKKPKVVWTGSPTHYLDHPDIKLKGDMDNAWLEWIIKSVKENKIEFLLMGAMRIPFFFEELKGYENFKIIRWLNSYQYTSVLLEYQPDIGIMPLVPNYFNYSKSDIKMIEYFASGCVAIGTSPFSTNKSSPYDNCFHKLPDICTVSDIEYLIDKVTEPEVYNKTIKDQYQYLIDNNRYLESSGYINELCKII